MNVSSIPAKKKSGLSSDQAYRVQSKLISKIKYIYSNARFFKLSHDEILERMYKEVYQTKEWHKAPKHVCSYVYGFLEAQRDALFNNDLEWRLFYRGELVLSKEVPDIVWSEVDTSKCGYTWKGFPDKLFS